MPFLLGLQEPMQFSVIIPAKNAAGSLKSAIMSALTQTEVTTEVIVVDDGSNDQTAHVAHEIRRSDNRVVVLRNPTSVGVSAARNQAIAAARGEWVAPLDADDEFLPGRLNQLRREAEARDVDMLADNLALRSEAGQDLGVAFSETNLQQQNSVSLDVFLLHDIPHMQPMGVGFCKPIIKRLFLSTHGLRYNETLSCNEDLLFYAECLISGARFGFSRSAGYLYTVRSGGHGTSFNLQASEVNRFLTKAARELRPSALPVLLMRQRAIDYDAFTKSLRATQYSEALRFLSRLSPLFVATRVVGIAARHLKRLVAVRRRLRGLYSG